MRKRFTIRYDPPRPNGLQHYARPGWVWRCRYCGKYGRHSYGATTSKHPWERCWDSIQYHAWRSEYVRR